MEFALVILLTIMRLLEAKGVLDRIVARVTPLLHPLGIPDLGVFALLQVLFASFAAPPATLTMMDKGGLSQRHIAAPLLGWLDLPTSVTLPIVTKAVAGGTAMMGVASDMLLQGVMSANDFNRIAGPLDQPS